MRLNHYLKFSNCYLRNKLDINTPFLAVLRVTYRCNLRCSFCQVWKMKTDEEIGFPIYKQAIDDLKRLHVPYLNITGGEPLLKQDILKITKYAISKGMYVTFNTNATLIDEKNAREIANSADSLKISIDGTEAVHDKIRGVKSAYAKAARGIEHLMKAQPRRAKVIVHFVANKNNIGEMKKVAERFYDKVDSFSIMPEFDVKKGYLYDTQKFRDSWKEINRRYPLQQSKEVMTYPSFDVGKRFCDAGKYYFSIIPDGTVIVCPNGVAVLGNLKDESLYSIWNRPLSLETKKKIKDCKGCFSRCTTEVSIYMRKSPFELFLKAPGLKKRVGL